MRLPRPLWDTPPAAALGWGVLQLHWEAEMSSAAQEPGSHGDTGHHHPLECLLDSAPSCTLLPLPAGPTPAPPGGVAFPTWQMKHLRHRGAEQFTRKSPASTELAQLAFLLCPSTIY